MHCLQAFHDAETTVGSDIRDVLAVLASPVREILEPGGTDDA